MEKAVALPVSRRKDLNRFFWVPAVAGLLVFAVATIPPGGRRSVLLKKNLQRARAIHSALASRDRALLQWERALRTDPFFNEEMLRAKMKYRKPGEGVIHSGTQAAALTPFTSLKIPDFVPSRPRSPGLKRQIADWALLLTSALLLAAAFILFDRPYGHDRLKRMRRSPG